MSSVEEFDTAGAPLELGAWQPGPNAPAMYFNGGLITAQPIIATNAVNVVSTGAAGTYVLNFGVTFPNFVVVTAIAGLDQTNGDAVILTLVSTSPTNFGFAMIELLPAGTQAVPVGHQVTVEWHAIGA